MLRFPILDIKGMRIMMLQVSGFYCNISLSVPVYGPVSVL